MPATARARARAEITSEILAVARRHLTQDGAAALSLRAVAREVGMVSSAIYRYFPSRDDLLTRLIIDAYESVGAAAEVADAAVDRADHVGRCVATFTAVRTWAVSHPQEYALVYGTPVPGYAAPVDTVDPAARVVTVMLGVLRDGIADGAIATGEQIHTTRQVRSDFGNFRALAPGVPDEVLSRALIAWTQVFGHISYELFGHLHGGITDYDGFFDLQARRMAAYVIEGTG
ncbi:MAG: TetR/AcrR family transcriptional regulator [Acidimicrobiales bacterium]